MALIKSSRLISNNFLFIFCIIETFSMYTSKLAKNISFGNLLNNVRTHTTTHYSIVPRENDKRWKGSSSV